MDSANFDGESEDFDRDGFTDDVWIGAAQNLFADPQMYIIAKQLEADHQALMVDLAASLFPPGWEADQDALRRSIGRKIQRANQQLRRKLGIARTPGRPRKPKRGVGRPKNPTSPQGLF